MIISIRCIATAIVLAALTSSTLHVGRAQAQSGEAAAAIEAVVKSYLARHPEEIEKVVRDYLVKHPEVLQAALVDLFAKRTAANAAANVAKPTPPAPDKSAAVKSNAPALFDSTHQVTLGDRQGDVTMVEFFDYNCGFCKRALADMQALMQAGSRLRVVLKEFPVLGQGSSEAARVAIAARMQDPDGGKYFELHQKLLGARGPSNKDSALAAAREVGLDMTRLEQDMASDEVRATLEENSNLARALGINGTPSYVIGTNVVIGAVGLPTLKDKVQTERR